MLRVSLSFEQITLALAAYTCYLILGSWTFFLFGSLNTAFMFGIFSTLDFYGVKAADAALAIVCVIKI